MDRSVFYKEVKYKARDHAAIRTQEYLYNQLFPYIGNKRKLLPLVWEAILKREDLNKSHLAHIDLCLFLTSLDEEDSQALAFATSNCTTLLNRLHREGTQEEIRKN